MTRNAVRTFVRASQRRAAKLEKAEQSQREEYLSAIRLTELEVIAQKEWEIFLYNLAFERIKERFTGNALAAFQSMLDGESATAAAKRLEIAVDSVHRLRLRVKNRLAEEVDLLQEELEP